jgi:hypothetical protein
MYAKNIKNEEILDLTSEGFTIYLLLMSLIFCEE